MIKREIKRILLTTGSAGLLFSAATAALAAAPGGGGFGQYTVTGGVITSSGVSGQTAAPVTLVSGNGFLQQQVTTAEGTFYRTIILDSGVTATNAAAVQALGFRNETFTGSTSNSGALASDGYVALAAPTGIATAGSGSTSNVTLAGVTMATNSTEAILARGALAVTGTPDQIKAGTADATGIKILQAHDFNVDTNATGTVTAENTGMSGAMQVNFEFLSNGEAADQADRSNYMRIDQVRNAGVATPGSMTVRRSSGDFTTGGGTLTLPDGQTLAYAAGDDIAVTWVDNGTLGGGTFGYPTTGTAVGNAASANGINQTESFRNYTTNSVVRWANGTRRQVATNGATIGGSLTGYPEVLFTPLITGASAVQSWPAANWDPNFGTAPVATTQNVAGTGVNKVTTMTQAFPN